MTAAAVSTGAGADAKSCGGADGNCATAFGTAAVSCGDTGIDCAAAFQPATDQPVNTAAARTLTREVTLRVGRASGTERLLLNRAPGTFHVFMARKGHDMCYS